MKLIGIVGRTYYNKDEQKIIQLNDFLRKSLADYQDIVPIILTPTEQIDYLDITPGTDRVDKEKLDYILNKCDAFIVPGGSYFHKFDEYIIEYAIKTNKPLLAICAGFQILCSMYALNRDKFDMTKRLPNDRHYGEKSKYIHKNIIIKDTLLSKIINKNVIDVNSLHHDYIDFKMKKLKISSISEDNIIEAVELPDHPFLIGIEWHPEYLNDENSKKIFDYFVKSIN